MCARRLLHLRKQCTHTGIIWSAIATLLIPAYYYQLIHLVKERPVVKTGQKYPSSCKLLAQRHLCPTSLKRFLTRDASPLSNGGAKRDRTADLLRARQALSQLSYSPALTCYLIAWTALPLLTQSVTY